MRARRLVPLLLLVAVTAPAASAAERVATVGGMVSDTPQLAGSQVAWQELTCVRNCGDSRIDCPPEGLTNAYSVRLGQPGRPPRTLFRRRLACAGSGPNHSHQSVSALVSPRRLALLQQAFSGSDISESIIGGLRAGPRAGPLTRIYRCGRGDQIGFTGGLSLFALDADRVAYDSTPCADSRRLAVRDLGSGETRIVPHPAVASISAIALSGQYLGYLRSDEGVAVYDHVTGALAYSWDAPAATAVIGFDLDSAGRLAIVTRERSSDPATCDTERLAWLSPAEPTPHPLPGSPCAPTVRIDGDHVQFSSARSVDEVTLAGERRWVARFGAVENRAFDADAVQITYALLSCGRNFVIYTHRLDEPTYYAGPARCEVRVAASRLRSVNGRVRVPLRCPRACSGILRLRRGSSQLTARRFGSERRRARTVVLRLGGEARAALRRGSLAVTVAVVVNDRDRRTHVVRRTVRLSGS